MKEKIFINARIIDPSQNMDEIGSLILNDKGKVKAIGKNVKKAREEKGLTQLQLSQAIGHKSVTIISRAEICYKGQHFNIEHLSKIAHILEIDICELLSKK